MVAGFIGWLNVAVGAVAVTIFLLLLTLVGTFVASALGFVKITVGADCAINLFCKPPAHPARSSTVKHVRDFNSTSNFRNILPSSTKQSLLLDWIVAAGLFNNR